MYWVLVDELRHKSETCASQDNQDFRIIGVDSDIEFWNIKTLRCEV